MPFIRGRILPEITETGRAKRTLDVLLWLKALDRCDAAALDEVEVLREYLQSITPLACTVNLYLREEPRDIRTALNSLRIRTIRIEVAEPNPRVGRALGSNAPAELVRAVSTALACDADVLLVDSHEWFPFIDECEGIGVLLAEGSVLKRQGEIFVRGHDVPWAFPQMIWNRPWTGFYQLAEPETFSLGLRVWEQAGTKAVQRPVVESLRSLIHNRLPHLCFTRDRLLFYEQQQSASRRAMWRRQRFTVEVAYYLNYYYLLLYGGFDHIAEVANGLLQVGVPERSVGATYDRFLNALAAVAPDVHALFTEGSTVQFMKRIGALRHLSAHRGAIAPSDVYEKPEVEPTVENLDAEITASGRDRSLAFVPPSLAVGFRETLRTQARLNRYSKLMEGAALIEVDGKQGWIFPLLDTEWNFQRFHRFLNTVLSRCVVRLGWK